MTQHHPEIKEFLSSPVPCMFGLSEHTTKALQIVAVSLFTAFVFSYCDVKLSAFRVGPKLFKSLARPFASQSPLPVMSSVSNCRQALDALPSTPENIPAFFFAHGSPMLAYPSGDTASGGMFSYQGPNGPLAKFLADFGPALLKKYQPKGIVVFSAHWETDGERVGET